MTPPGFVGDDNFDTGSEGGATDRDSCPELRDAELDILDSHAVP
eukprot:CAMPEP_0179937344 /NCGR_PEP_ID=MMETSP0983-20121128/14267_1 /TAXON_ID=483367 /ORGANISM="non described non described, Strain CCMP 2436" /LENGTH=43 /DNA_ID= /DNA_START= /DNA_END= /DNA_ORIENTATION=